MLGDPSYALICAVRTGDLEGSKTLLDSYSLSHSKAWSEGYNLLREALQHKQEETAKLLLTRGAKVNSKSKRQSETPLHFAVTNGFVDVVDMLVDRDASVNAKDHSDNTALHCAVEKDSLEIVKSLLKKRVSLEVRSAEGMTPLHLAAHMGRTQICEALLDHHANVNAIATSSWKRGHTPLHFAATRVDGTTVALLLSRGAKVNAIGKEKSTPLHVAVEMNRYESAKLLLKHGANVNNQDVNGKTILCYAVGKGNLQMTELILEHCPDRNSKENQECLYIAITSSYGTAHGEIVNALLRYGFGINAEAAKDSKLLHAAVRKGYLQIVENLLKLGVNVNSELKHKKGVTLLHEAAANKQIGIAKLLIDHNANINAKDGNAKSPIYYAVENHDAEIIELLLNKGAYAKGRPSLLNAAVETLRKDIVEMILQHEPTINVNVNEKAGITALYATMIAGEFNLIIPRVPAKKENEENDPDTIKKEIAEILLRRGARVNAVTKSGETALHAAVQNGYEKTVQLLLEHKAAVNAFDKKKVTPLHSCASRGNVEIMKILLDRGAIVNAKSIDGDTPLHIAVKRNHVNAVELLVEHGADISIRNNLGETSLHTAATCSDREVIETLLNHFDDVDGRDRCGRTALHIAAKLGKLENVNVLLDHDSDVNLTCHEENTPLNYATIGTAEYDDRHMDAMFDHSFDYDSYDEFGDFGYLNYYDNDDDDDDYYQHYFDHDFRDSISQFSDYPYEEVAEMLEHHIVKLIAMNRYVSEKNLEAISLCDDHKDIYEECQEEIECMKKEKIGESKVSFYDILTKGMNQLTLYTRNQSIVDTLEDGGHRDEFDLYSGMIDSRFKNAQKRERLLGPSLKSLSSLTGYDLPDLSTTELFNYLSNKDLENLIKADSSIGKESDC